MAKTLRLSPALDAEATVLAERLGISFNALVSVALRAYLDKQGPKRVRTASEPLSGLSGIPSTGAAGSSLQRPLSRAERRRLEREQRKRGGHDAGSD